MTNFKKGSVISVRIKNRIYNGVIIKRNGHDYNRRLEIKCKNGDFYVSFFLGSKDVEIL